MKNMKIIEKYGIMELLELAVISVLI